MNVLEKSLQEFKNKGFRLTKVRVAMLEIFLKSRAPLSAYDIGLLLLQKNLMVNKTTVYRELLFLKEQNIVQEIQFGDGKVRYEIAHHHHHHIVCMQCGIVKDVILENDLADQEKRIEKNSNFKILNHSLEFFGLCEKCR